MATTIAVSHETKEKLKLLGGAGDSFEDVILKMYAVASKHILLTYLYDESDSIDISEARRRLNRDKSNHS